QGRGRVICQPTHDPKPDRVGENLKRGHIVVWGAAGCYRDSPSARRILPLRPGCRQALPRKLIAMKRLEATGLVPAPSEDVFAFLSALENHWAVAGRWIKVVSLDRSVGATGGRVRISGP